MGKRRRRMRRKIRRRVYSSVSCLLSHLVTMSAPLQGERKKNRKQKMLLHAVRKVLIL